MTTERMTTEPVQLGKLITNYDGRCRGPRYGQVYTAARGDHGYYAGYRSHANPGLGLMGVTHYATERAAQDAAVRMTDN